MTSHLDLYNSTLLELGERKISSLSENRESRRVLDDVYDQTVAECLEAGDWNFGLRSVKIDSDSGLTTDFGYQNVFTKPDDWVRTVGLSADERFAMPLIAYVDETSYWLADVDPIYVRYLSNDTSFGMDLSRWTAGFANYVIMSLAEASCTRIKENANVKAQLGKDMEKARRSALNKDARNEAPKFLPQGSWVSSRRGVASRGRGWRNGNDILT